MELADGFEANYTIDDETNTATITITKVADYGLAGEMTLAKLPVRILYYDTDINIDGYTAETYWTTYAFWAQDMKMDVDKGVITYVDGYKSNVLNTFSNEEFHVDTEMYTSMANMDKAYFAEHGTTHVHTPVALEDKASTCSEAGYTDRTFCEGCNSVVDWGEALPTTEHNYTLNGDKLTCACGMLSTESGLIIEGGKSYYAINGKLLSGWQMVGEDWYYFDKTTYAGVDGDRTTEEGIKYNFDNGRVTDGVWKKTSSGTRYWYGPGYYKDTSPDLSSSKPVVIHGNTYLFNRYGYMQTGIAKSGEGDYNGIEVTYVYYDCGTNGIATRIEGPFSDGYFYLSGIRQKAYKVLEHDGNWYYIGNHNYYAKSKTIFVEEKLLANTGLPAGYFTVDESGKMSVANGPDADGYFYLDGARQKAYHIYEFEGNYYYVSDGHKLVVNKTTYLTDALLAETGLSAGYYTFDESGKMAVKNGPDADGFFYINGIRQKAYQVLEHDGNWYYVGNYNKFVTNNSIFVEAKLLEGKPLTSGFYEFDESGKMTIKNGPASDGYLYINGARQKAYQVYEYAGDYYYVADNHKIVTNKILNLTSSLIGDLELTPAYYEADAEGKLTVLDGPASDGYFYLDGVRQKAYQIIKYGEDYYYVSNYNKYLVNKTVFVETKLLEGTPLKAGNYDFDAEGKMVLKNGPDADGYFYLKGVKQKAYQVIEFEGNYYYIGNYNKYLVNKTVFVESKLLEGTPLKAGHYDFDAEGKMVLKNGPDADGYFYLKGVKQSAYQVIEFEGNYYYIGDYNKYVVNKRVFVESKFLEGTPLKQGNYEFDENGKMILKNGPNADGYFYINGVKQLAYQVIEFEGNFYYVSDGHKYAVNKTTFIDTKYLEGTGLKKGSYSFDAEGKMILK